MPRNLNAKGGSLPSDNVVPVLGAVGRQLAPDPLNHRTRVSIENLRSDQAAGALGLRWRTTRDQHLL